MKYFKIGCALPGAFILSNIIVFAFCSFTGTKPSHRDGYGAAVMGLGIILMVLAILQINKEEKKKREISEIEKLEDDE